MFVAVVGEPLPPTSTGDPDTGAATKTLAAVITSRHFWNDYVKPRLPTALADNEAVKSGIRVIPENNRDVRKRQIVDIKLEVAIGGEQVFDAVVAAVEQLQRERAQKRFSEIGDYLVQAHTEAMARNNVEQQRRIDAEMDKWIAAKTDPTAYHNGRFVLEISKP